MKQIIYAAVGLREGESIVAVGESEETMRPIVCMDANLIPAMLETCSQMAAEYKSKIAVCQFELVKVIETFDGTNETKNNLT